MWEISSKTILRIIEASSFKLNWILDPFMSIGDVGVACKTIGDVLLASKQIKIIYYCL